MSLLPKLVQEKPHHKLEDWPIVHIWKSGIVIVEEMSHVLVWSPEYTGFRRYEWAALSDFPKTDVRLTGIEAISYILNRMEGEFSSKTGT